MRLAFVTINGVAWGGSEVLWVKTAKLAEPEAAFQPGKLELPTLADVEKPSTLVDLPELTPTELPPVTKLPEMKPPSQKELVLPQIITSPESVKTVSLPTKGGKKSSGIRIPKIKSTAVKPSPVRIKGRKSEPVFVPPTGGFQLPTDSTVIPQIPIVSPSAVEVKRPMKAKTKSVRLCTCCV